MANLCYTSPPSFFYLNEGTQWQMSLAAADFYSILVGISADLPPRKPLREKFSSLRWKSKHGVCDSEPAPLFFFMVNQIPIPQGPGR